MNSTTATSIAFDDVKAGDTLRYQQVTRGFMPDIRTITAQVDRVTANTVYLDGGARLTRKNWYDKAALLVTDESADA